MKPQILQYFVVLLMGTFAARGDSLPDPTPPPPVAVCGVNHCFFGRQPSEAEPGPIFQYHIGSPVTVNYTAFNGVKYVMRECYGNYTSLLIKPADLVVFTEAQAWELVDQADYLYATFKELMGTEPQGSGRLRIAFVDNCGAGCGNVGSKGVELQPYFATGGVWFARGDLQDLYPYLAHEMTHNFDRWSSYVMIGSDTAHAWTSFMDVYIVSANRFGQAPNSGGGRGYAPDDLLKKRVDDFLGPYLAIPGSTWESCVRDKACTNVDQVQVQGGFTARLAQLVGPIATQQALAELKKAATTRELNPATMTPESRNDLLLECFSRGAHTNLTCVTASLHWTVSAAMQSQLTSLFGADCYACLDSDGDGYTPLADDLNDTLASVHPGATETLNGTDDDCDGITDDLLASESSDFPNSLSAATSLTFPFRVKGNISSSSDGDYFKITLGTSTRVRFSLKSGGAFAGWLFLYDRNGNWLTYSYCGAGSQSDLDVIFPSGTWRFSVSQNSSSTPGSYELVAAPHVDWPVYTYPGKPSLVDSNTWLLVSSSLPTNLVDFPDLQARFWVSGFGWVGTNSLGTSSLSATTWVAPSNLPPAETTCRSQFYRANTPLERATEALPLSGGVPTFLTLNSNRTFSFSWSGASPGLSPSSATSLAGTWTLITNSPAFTNGQFRITIPRGNESGKYFRLGL